MIRQVITPMAESCKVGSVDTLDTLIEAHKVNIRLCIEMVYANDAGAGWYDFAHDITTGNESVKIVSGANSVLYGSCKYGWYYFYRNDNFDPKGICHGDNYEKFYAGYKNVSISRFDVSNGSVKTLTMKLTVMLILLLEQKQNY